MKDEIQKHGQSPSAILQQNKRDDARPIFTEWNHPIYFALTHKYKTAEQPTAGAVVRNNLVYI